MPRPIKIDAPALRLDPDRALESLDWSEIFGSDCPVEIELGIGVGRFLLAAATLRPEVNHLGIEWANKYLRIAERRADKRGLKNIRFARLDGRELICRTVPDHSVSAYYVFYPDPWPKKRHHKRRILQPAFLELVHSRLLPDGALHIATDWANYAEHIDEVFAACSLFVCDERREHGGEAPMDRPQTKFERRGLRKGHRIYDWRFAKNPNNH